MLLIVRKATLNDVGALENLIAESARALSRSYYTPEQVEGALGTVLGIDTQLIRDGTYFVVESDAGIVGCGGWSRRKTLFGGDAVGGKNDQFLDPQVDAARIRAFFVHPAAARRGIGSRLMHACESAALAEGFTRLELVATLPGEPLYLAHGFSPCERFDVPLANGAVLPVIRMSKSVEHALR
jgi:N-acetylglutamate synthase-like GNAT family acetyltransferase